MSAPPTHTSRPDGYAVVLTADRTLMSDYPTLFDGIMGTIQTTSVPEFVMRRFISPPAIKDGVRLRKAPLGLRRIEAALLRDGFSAGDLIMVAPEDIHAVVGPRTKIVAVASGDPLGLGMSNTTMVHMAGGRLYTCLWFGSLMRQLGEWKSRFNFRVVVGGSGAWQFRQCENERAALGIDTVVTGYAEGAVSRLFRALADGGDAPPFVEAETPAEGDIPPVAHATSMGVVELSRGCGKGCEFCTIARERMIHLPETTILRDVDTNLAQGVDSIVLISEDVFRYGTPSHVNGVNPPALKSLARQIRARPGLRLIQFDHANIISAARYSDDDLREVYATLTAGQRHEYLWLNLGVETASGRLLELNSRGGKIRPWQASEWGDLCEETCRRLVRAGFFPFVSVILGLPGETPDDVRQTVRLVERLFHEKLCVFPIFHAPVSAAQGRQFTIDDMSPDHWRLFRLGDELNFKWIPRMYWDNQVGAGVGPGKRLFIQVTGRLQTLQWKARFAWKSRKLWEPKPKPLLAAASRAPA